MICIRHSVHPKQAIIIRWEPHLLQFSLNDYLLTPQQGHWTNVSLGVWGQPDRCLADMPKKLTILSLKKNSSLLLVKTSYIHHRQHVRPAVAISVPWVHSESILYGIKSLSSPKNVNLWTECWRVLKRSINQQINTQNEFLKIKKMLQIHKDFSLSGSCII